MQHVCGVLGMPRIFEVTSLQSRLFRDLEWSVYSPEEFLLSNLVEPSQNTFCGHCIGNPYTELPVRKKRKQFSIFHLMSRKAATKAAAKSGVFFSLYCPCLAFFYNGFLQVLETTKVHTLRQNCLDLEALRS